MIDSTALAAERLHAALSSTFEGFYSVVVEASFERRAGHSKLLFPSMSQQAMFNGVVVESEPCSGIADSIRQVEAAGARCGVQLRESRHREVEAELARLGFTSRSPMPGMAVAPAELAEIEVDGLTIDVATDEASLAEAADVAAAGFAAPVEAIMPLYASGVLSLDGFAVYVGRVGGEAVTTGVGYRLGREVGIFSVATPPEHRGRGYGGAVSAHAAREGLEAGADLAWLQTSELGEPVYRRLGFRHVAMHWLLTRPR